MKRKNTFFFEYCTQKKNEDKKKHIRLFIIGTKTLYNKYM